MSRSVAVPAVRRAAATIQVNDSPELAALRQKLNKYKEKGDFDNCKLLKLQIDARAKYEDCCAGLASCITDFDERYRKALGRDDFDGAKRILEQLPQLQKQPNLFWQLPTGRCFQMCR
jgi:hypothetical protein